MSKDYHKGVRLQVYIPDELHEILLDQSNKYNMSKTKIVIDALYSFIGPSARDSAEKLYFDKHTI